MVTEPMKGLLLHVMRPANFPDCTLGGVSARGDSLILVGTKKHGEPMAALPRDCEVFPVTDDHPAVVMEESYLRGALPHLVPLDTMPRHSMMGGNYATGDSRFGKLVERVFGGPKCVSALPVHDRIE